MQLLRVTMGVSIALRMATNAPSSRSTVAVAKRTPNHRSKVGPAVVAAADLPRDSLQKQYNNATNAPSSRSTVAVAKRAPNHRIKAISAAVAAAPLSLESLQKQLWELSKISTDEFESKLLRWIIEGGEPKHESLLLLVKNLSDRNEFTAIEKLLKADKLSLMNNDMVPDIKFFTEVLWAAVLAKSLGSLPPSILSWIDTAVVRLSEPIEAKKQSIIWLLAILRGDLPQLQRLQQESISKNGVVGPTIERERTLRHTALAYFDAGKKEEFGLLWGFAERSFLGGDVFQQRLLAILHHTVMRKAKLNKPDPSMLRWYAELLSAHQRTPIPENPQFNTMMEPVIRALGGRIRRWNYSEERKGGGRAKKLSKWRDDYDDVELDNLVNSMLDFMRHQVGLNEKWKLEDLNRLERMLNRVNDEERRQTVVVDWENFNGMRQEGKEYPSVTSLFPSHSLVIVGRESGDGGQNSHQIPGESDQVKVMEVTAEAEFVGQDADDICSMILAVATRGHLLSNDMMKGHIQQFTEFLQANSKDSGQSILLKKYLTDASLKCDIAQTQWAVDYSRAAQWIDKEKKELAFTISRTPPHFTEKTTSYKYINYYSMVID